jgi:hypothetical protein
LNEWIKACSNQNQNWKNCEICHKPYRIEFKPKKIFARDSYHFKTGELLLFIIAIISSLICLGSGLYFIPILIVYYILEREGLLICCVKLFQIVTAVNIWEQIQYATVTVFLLCSGVKV